MNNKYLNRYGWKESLFDNYNLIEPIDIIVVIPCFRETHIDATLNSLEKCNVSGLSIMVIIVINEPNNASIEIVTTNKATLEFLKGNSYNSFDLRYGYVKLPEKKAGVGLARKIGMDEAVKFFHFNNLDGLIACFDADSTCDPDYFQAIKNHFNHKQQELGLVYYEHPLEGQNKEFILNYELFLRYYTDGLRSTGFPYAFQTLGSCIVVTNSAYQKYGGMSPKQAGEDFYFINKIAMHGNVGEINDTRIIPSSRISDRVPFGTGHALGKMKDKERNNKVYNPQIFEIIKLFFLSVFDKDNATQDTILLEFLSSIDFRTNTSRILSEAKNEIQFSYRFFQWFDNFKLLKLTHYLDSKIDRIDLGEAVNILDEKYYHLGLSNVKKIEKLKAIRAHNQTHPLN